MKKILLSVLVSSFVAVGLPVAVAAGLEFATVVDSLDPQKNTKLAVKEYWKGISGQEVSWSGQVMEVKGGSSKVKIWVANKARPLYKGYNIVVVTRDVEKAATLKKGQTVHFKGSLDDYDDFRGGTIIFLSDAALI